MCTLGPAPLEQEMKPLACTINVLYTLIVELGDDGYEHLHPPAEVIPYMCMYNCAPPELAIAPGAAAAWQCRTTRKAMCGNTQPMCM